MRLPPSGNGAADPHPLWCGTIPKGPTIPNTTSRAFVDTIVDAIQKAAATIRYMTPVEHPLKVDGDVK